MADKEYCQYSLSVSKALNSSEAPLKVKHARFIIITTHHHKECNTLWKLLSSQPIMENRFTAWKFCHLLHKVLREGHSSSIQQSQSHKKMILEMGKLWGHLDDLGSCIQSYSKLLVRKLDFHCKNSFFPGSFAVSIEDFKKYAGNDINVHFQLCVEMFDFLEDILILQNCIFQSVNSYRMFSMSASAQCRLAPLITLIQDSNPLYDFCVRIMFKLHDNLHADLLSGHRSRFKEIFLKLKTFYDKVRPLQYFEDLIQVPCLPESAPNFSSKVDFGNYIPPVVKVPEADPKADMGNLVDVSVSKVLEEPSENNKYKQLLHTKELTLTKMEIDILTLRENFNTYKEKYKTEKEELIGQLSVLRSELLLSNELRANMQEQISIIPDLVQKNSELEEKAKNIEEKYNKLKTMYSQTREEHIRLLRQTGESNKLLSQEKQNSEDLKSENDFIKVQLNDLLLKSKTYESEKKDFEHLLETLSLDVAQHKKEHSKLQSQVEKLKMLEESNSTQMASSKNDLIQKTEEYNKVREHVLRLESELNIRKEEAEKKAHSYEDILTRLNSDLHTKTLELNELKETYRLTQIEENAKNLNSHGQLEQVTQTLQIKELECKQISEKFEEQKRDFQRLMNELQERCDQAYRDLNLAAIEKSFVEDKNKEYVEFILKNFVSTVCTTYNTVQQSSKSSLYILDGLKKHLDCIYGMHNENYMKEETIKRIFESILCFSNLLAMLQGDCGFTCKTITDIKHGEKLWKLIQSLSSPISKMFTAIQFQHSYVFIEETEELKSKLFELEDVLRGISKAQNENLDLADRIKGELADMERTIAEATEKFIEMLKHTKSKDDGIKLKVNEKILDACTNLMECIKILIQRSKVLQDEIILSGRGSVTLKEFYNRNSEWTEGLISAAKSIAKGAIFLVDAANNAVIKDSSNNMEIIVAAQEIAACTAQLVVASKVKAPKDSMHLQELTTASRSVSQATGAVVAIVRDCVEQIERHSEIDVFKLTSSQAKTAEMNIQVKVLELEQALQIERQKLASFRKNLYKNSEN